MDKIHNCSIINHEGDIFYFPNQFINRYGDQFAVMVCYTIGAF